MGDPARFRTLDDLRQALAAAPAAPRDRGRVALIATRRGGGQRELPARVRVTPEDGMPGDAWGRDPKRVPEAQLAVMQSNIAELIANGQPVELAGDNLWLDLDLSAANLPVGSHVRVGTALLEVTPKAHNGCKKFRGRFGEDALRFTAAPETRHLNLRGIYLKVVEAGEVAVGDAAEVVRRGM